MNTLSQRLSIPLSMAVLGGLCACPFGGLGTPAPAAPWVLKSYDVPAAYASEINSVVSSLLKTDKDKPEGSSRVALGAKLMVAAPAAFQSGVQELVDTLRAH